MREALLEGHDLALSLTVVSLRVEGDHPAALQTSVHVLKEDAIGTRLAVHRDKTADTLHERPLDLPRDQQRGVAEEVNSRLSRKGREDGKRIEPVQVVGDQDVGAVRRNVLATFHPDPEEHMQEWYDGQLEEAKHRSRLALDRKQVSRRDTGPRFHGCLYVTASSPPGSGRPVRHQSLAARPPRRNRSRWPGS